MAYSEDPTIIKNRILSNMPDSTDKTEGYIAYDSASALGKELSSNLSFLDQILAYAFPQTSSGIFLNYNAESRGIVKNLGVKSIGQATFIGTDATLIPKGFLIQTNGGLQYTLDDDAIINSGTVTVSITAIAIGTAYNVASGVINGIPVQQAGITSVNNSTPTTGGTNDETEDELRARILKKVQNPPSCGNKIDYERWAKEVSGVEYAKIIPLWNGNGTVKVIASGINGSILDSTILNNVKNHIDPGNGSGEGQAPIGANVTIATVMLVSINISITGLEIEDGYGVDSVKNNISNAIISHLAGLLPGDELKYNDIRAIFTLAQGVSDFTDFKVNNSTSNIELTDEQKASLGTISYS